MRFMAWNSFFRRRGLGITSDALRSLMPSARRPRKGSPALTIFLPVIHRQDRVPEPDGQQVVRLALAQAPLGREPAIRPRVNRFAEADADVGRARKLAPSRKRLKCAAN